MFSMTTRSQPPSSTLIAIAHYTPVVKSMVGRKIKFCISPIDDAWSRSPQISPNTVGRQHASLSAPPGRSSSYGPKIPEGDPRSVLARCQCCRGRWLQHPPHGLGHVGTGPFDLASIPWSTVGSPSPFPRCELQSRPGSKDGGTATVCRRPGRFLGRQLAANSRFGRHHTLRLPGHLVGQDAHHAGE